MVDLTEDPLICCTPCNKPVVCVRLQYVYRLFGGRVKLKRDGTWRRTGGEVKVKLANGVSSQDPLHYHGTWCI